MRRERKEWDGKDYPENWHEVYCWLGKARTWIEGKIPAYGGKCTSQAKRRISGVAYNGSVLRQQRPIAGMDVELVKRKVCAMPEFYDYKSGCYLRGAPSIHFEEQAVLNTLHRAQAILPNKMIVLNVNNAVPDNKQWSTKWGYGRADEMFEKWCEKENNGYDYFPKWFAEILSKVSSATA